MRICPCNPPLIIPECMDYRIVPKLFADNASPPGYDDYAPPCPGAGRYCGQPTIVWAPTYEEMGEDEEFLEFMARLAAKLNEAPGYDYYYAVRIANQWVRCITRFISINTKERLIYELERLEKVMTPTMLWQSKRHLVPNPMKLMQIIAPLAKLLDPIEFADIFEEYWRWVSNNIEKWAKELAEEMEKTGVCGVGSGSFWCEEAAEMVKILVENKIKLIVEKLVVFSS